MIKNFVSPWKKYFLLTLILVIGTGSVLLPVVDAWQVNIWSLGYSKITLTERLEISRYALLPPKDHQRALLWLASQALAEGDPLKAQILVKQLANENNMSALYILGETLVEMGNFHRAVQIWQKAGIYNALNQAAIQAKEEGRSQDALLAGQAAWELDPEKGTLSLATLLSDAGDLEAAKALVYQMIAEYPTSPQRQAWLLRLGDISRNQESWNDAASFYLQVLDKHPKSIKAHIGLGWVYYERGDSVEAAIQEFLLATRQTPENGQGYFAIGQVLKREHRYAEADVWFDKAINNNPGNRSWWLERANSLRAAGNLSDALIRYTETIQRFEGWAPGYYEISWAYKLSGDVTNAVNAIERALALSEKLEGKYYFRAGKIYEWADLKMKALNAYRQAIVLLPENEQIQATLKDLQEIIEE